MGPSAQWIRGVALAGAAACLLISAGAGGQAAAFPGVNYGPFHRPGQSPEHTVRLSAEHLEADLAAISAAGFRVVRTFGLDNGLDQIVPIAHRRFPKMAFFIGVYVCGTGHDDSANPHSTRSQMNAAIRLANAYDSVEAIVVGNECLAGEPEACRQPVAVEQLIADIEDVRRGLADPARARVRVTTAMSMVAAVKHYETHGRRLAAHVDAVMVNIYPFFDKLAAADAPQAFAGALQHVMRLYAFSGKSVIVGETGWPSAGPANGAAVPGREHQADYLRAVSRYARAHRIELFLFEMFDEPWKQAAESVGPHWGLFDSGGRPKFSPPFPWAAD
ncbi:MAG: glycosyl hydrolase family 17 protein [Desulfobacterales bacterium]|jgi:glucan 1,3-beta-glucosidase|nr:glycosyl hydrolase family 17 protein [Desulfobacterales bacterium]